jgi:hypothetical protein
MCPDDRYTNSEGNEGEPLPGVPPIRDYCAEYKAQLDAVQAQLDATRAELLTVFRALGLEQVEILYEGYNDSGNVEGLAFTPSTVKISGELCDRLKDFAWDFVCSIYPSFETYCGGSGFLEWDLADNTMDLTHYDHGSENGPSKHRGL